MTSVFHQNLCAHVLTNLRARIRSPYLGLHERDQDGRPIARLRTTELFLVTFDEAYFFTGGG